VSLADVETLVALTQRDDERGVPENYVRVSTGLEAAEDIIGDFEQALAHA
jgi:cystathionine beta-lyase/cystathionine gamma-synthase